MRWSACRASVTNCSNRSTAWTCFSSNRNMNACGLSPVRLARRVMRDFRVLGSLRLVATRGSIFSRSSHLVIPGTGRSKPHFFHAVATSAFRRRWDAESPGHVHQVGERVGLHLWHHLASVCLHRDLADVELATNLFVQPAGDYQRHDLAFATGE